MYRALVKCESDEECTDFILINGAMVCVCVHAFMAFRGG